RLFGLHGVLQVMGRPRVEQHARRGDPVLGVVGNTFQLGRGEGVDQARVLAAQLGQGVYVVTRRTLGFRVAGRRGVVGDNVLTCQQIAQADREEVAFGE